MNSYRRFVGMVAVSTIVMFALMYLNTYELDHVYLSETRAYRGSAGALARQRPLVDDDEAIGRWIASTPHFSHDRLRSSLVHALARPF